ncbi:MAG: hypothetical protein KatS3mg087_1015 [Patescibacteria group bacterium]|nr:MAG: hypothetical protein KatS3mg087_1015 [Patescibacteria group bacterium]
MKWYTDRENLQKAQELAQDNDFHILLLACSLSSVENFRKFVTDNNVMLTNRHYKNAIRSLYLDKKFQDYAEFYPPAIQALLVSSLCNVEYDDIRRTFVVRHAFEDKEEKTRELNNSEIDVLFTQLKEYIIYSFPRRIKNFIMSMLSHLLIYSEDIIGDSIAIFNRPKLLDTEVSYAVCDIHPDLLTAKTMMFYNLATLAYSDFWGNKRSKRLWVDEKKACRQKRTKEKLIRVTCSRSRERTCRVVQEKA